MGRLPAQPVRIVLVRPAHSGNVGAAARAIANHGLEGLDLVAPRGFDPEIARWMAPGAHTIIDHMRLFSTVADAIADRSLVIGTTARARKWRWPVWSPVDLADAHHAEPRHTAVLFGAEESGLTNQELSGCQALLRLPTAEHQSLNLAQAVLAVCVAIGTSAAKPAPAPPAGVPAAHREALVTALLPVLDEAEYFAGRSRPQVHAELSSMLSRLNPTDAEIRRLHGILQALKAPNRG